MSAHDLDPANKSKWLAHYARLAGRSDLQMARCEHGHYDAVVWGGTCGSEVIGAYSVIYYRQTHVAIRWTLRGWEHSIVPFGDWADGFDSRREAESDAAERIDLALS